MPRSELVGKALELVKAAGRTPERGSHDWWVTQWRDLAMVSDGLQKDDPRLGPVLSALARCDRLYKIQDVEGFNREAERVQRLMRFAPGGKVWWESMEHRQVMLLGPAVVELVHHDNGKLHVFVVWRDTERWLSETVIAKVEGPVS